MSEPITRKELNKTFKYHFEKQAKFINAAFQAQNDHLDRRFVKLETDVQELKSDVKRLEYGQENILLKFDHMAYRFELDELKQRMDKFERGQAAKNHR